MANHHHDWYMERTKGPYACEVGVVCFQFIVDYRVHFMGLASRVDVSGAESDLPHDGVRCLMGSSYCYRVGDFTGHGQTLRLVSESRTQKHLG